MTAAEEAYKEAQRLIADAKTTGALFLDFDTPKTHALNVLPPEITELTQLELIDLSDTQIGDVTLLADLTALTALSLSGTRVVDITPLAGLTTLTNLYLQDTQITDISHLTKLTALTFLSLSGVQIIDIAPLAGLTELTTLYLTGTHVTDLKPLRNLPSLTDPSDHGGLGFIGTEATRLDPHLAEIAEIEDNAERAKTLFDYLDKMEASGPTNAPQPDKLLPVSLKGGKLEIAASLPDEVERDDELKHVLHERLKPKTAELAQLAGNYHPRLAARARSLSQHIDRPFNDLDMLMIHLDIEDLSGVFNRRDSRTGEDIFSPEIIDALADVVKVGPGLTLDNDVVEKLEERKRRFEAAPLNPDIKAAHDAFSEVVANDADAIGENLRVLEARNLERSGEPSSDAIQDVTHRNMFIRLGRLALADGKSIALGAASSAVFYFLQTNSELIMPVLSSYGASFSEWFGAAMSNTADLNALSKNEDKD